VILRTHQDAGVWIGRGGRLEGHRSTQLAAALRDAGATLVPSANEPPGRLARRAGGRRAKGDLACYFEVHAPRDEIPPPLADSLRDVGAVEFAYTTPPIALPALPPHEVGPPPAGGPEPPGPLDDLRPRQGYLDPAPDGIGAAAAWERPGGRGDGVRIIDVEGEWHFTHEDFLADPGRLAGGRPDRDVENRNHGTNVLGMLGAQHNGRGIMGICPNAAIKAVSYEPERRWGSARAIKRAADALRPGDILLLEMMRPGPNTPPDAKTQLGYIAIEYWPHDLTAIQYAASRGILVVEAAGNGSQHLDDGVFGGPGRGFRPRRPNPFARDELDSGAIAVGAGAPPPGTHDKDYGPDRSRLDFSNWGSCIDAQGWGREVTTTGGLGLGPDDLRPGPVEDRWYTDRFSGTSSAAPMVAGALACVQGVLRAAGRRPLSPYEARSALRETGSPQAPAAPGGPIERIGSRPDIEKLIDWAMETARPVHDTTRRRPRMKVTITIEDDDGANIDWGPAGRGIEPPYIKGPSLIITHDDGRKTEIDIAALKAAADEKKNSA
jgi:hypothetical protein